MCIAVAPVALAAAIGAGMAWSYRRGYKRGQMGRREDERLGAIAAARMASDNGRRHDLDDVIAELDQEEE